MFTLPQPLSADTDAPILEVSESPTILQALLSFVYPVPDPPIHSLDELTPILTAAFKYEMTGVIEQLRKVLVVQHFLKENPTRVYAIASRFDLEGEARTASRYTLAVNILDCPLHDDLKYITAYAYHRLLDLHRRRAEAAQALLRLPEEVKCMRCNGTQYLAFSPPKWWLDFDVRAREELRVRPTTEVVFSLAFLTRSAQAGCERCAGSILDAHHFLEKLKNSIDELPSTI
ncbi:predicted protein [Sparassis crispa]|uniref:BTB domain-containing protein n=1 Tax=Sparassis crispa TaxID=139825 RepID=A0A401GDA1_9APHY|nr:predicted protein [Sparassis crispa]GBE80158.1 predicted protein [Sparassis crispa]